MADPAEDDSPTNTGQRIDVMMGEFRILIPMVGVVFGFQLTLSFSQAFADLDLALKYANFGALVATAATILFMVVPVSYHRFTRHFDDSRRFLDLARRSLGLALVVFPASIALSLYIQAVRTFDDHRAGAMVGATALLACMAAWWIVPKGLAHQQGHR